MVSRLDALGREISEAFRAKRRLLSFDEYFQLCAEQPTLQARSTAQYLRDMFLYFGSRTVEAAGRRVRRFELFDGVLTEGSAEETLLRAGDRLRGQEEVQDAVFRVLESFVRERRVNKLILLHGPNGSAKSTVIASMMRAMGAYSRSEEGALYRFRWVFPRSTVTQKGIGFGGAGPVASGASSYAYLPDDQVDARLPCELSDHPLLLVPGPERRRVLREALEEAGKGSSFPLSDYLEQGDLCPKCREISDALLTAYQGDWTEVLKHVQVERFFIDPRYRRAAVTVEPQLRVDAGIHQISRDASLDSLPPSLRHLAMFSPFGDLVDANRGLLEYNDLLKRPIEAWKYILATCEKSTVSLDNAILFLDAVFVGSSNELHLDAFKESPDFGAFKGRIELVRTPYLLDYRQEQQIYDDALAGMGDDVHVAPHTAEVAALWAVLTRLRRPRPERYDSEAIGEMVLRLTPLQKALVYAEGTVPETFSEEEARLLRGAIEDLRHDGETNEPYEGRVGASPRELKMVLQHAAQNEDHRCLGPLAVFDELARLVRDPSVYRFLQIKPEDRYLQPIPFVDVVRSHYLDQVLGELQQASGLVSPRQHEDLFERYVSHVMHWIRKEKIRNRITGEHEDPSQQLMEEVERILQVVGKPEAFRQNLIGRIGAWRVDNPDATLDQRALFPTYLRRIEESYFEQHRTRLEAILRDLLTVFGEGEQLEDAERQSVVVEMMAALQKLGYCESCGVDVAAVVLEERVRRKG